MHPRAYNVLGDARELTFSCSRRLPLLAKERSCRWLADAVQEARSGLAVAPADSAW